MAAPTPYMNAGDAQRVTSADSRHKYLISRASGSYRQVQSFIADAAIEGNLTRYVIIRFSQINTLCSQKDAGLGFVCSFSIV